MSSSRGHSWHWLAYVIPRQLRRESSCSVWAAAGAGFVLAGSPPAARARPLLTPPCCARAAPTIPLAQATEGKPIVCKAAIAWEAKKPLEVCEVTVDPPQARRGLCSVLSGPQLPPHACLPACLRLPGEVGVGRRLGGPTAAGCPREPGGSLLHRPISSAPGQAAAGGAACKAPCMFMCVYVCFVRAGG